MLITQPIKSDKLTLIPHFAAVSLTVTPTDDGWLLAEYRPWDLVVIGQNEDDLLKEIEAQIIFLWQEYVLADDSALSRPAQRLKRQLLKDWIATS